MHALLYSKSTIYEVCKEVNEVYIEAHFHTNIFDLSLSRALPCQIVRYINTSLLLPHTFYCSH